MKQLYASILPGQTCSTEQKQQYLIKSARASVESQKASEEHDAIQRQVAPPNVSISSSRLTFKWLRMPLTCLHVMHFGLGELIL